MYAIVFWIGPSSAYFKFIFVIFKQFKSIKTVNFAGFELGLSEYQASRLTIQPLPRSHWHQRPTFLIIIVGGVIREATDFFGHFAFSFPQHWSVRSFSLFVTENWTWVALNQSWFDPLTSQKSDSLNFSTGIALFRCSGVGIWNAVVRNLNKNNFADKILKQIAIEKVWNEYHRRHNLIAWNVTD